MVLTVDNDSKKIIATLHNGDRIEKFECKISACQNPVCTCGTAYLHLIPILTKNGNARQLSPRNVEIDIDEKSLECRDKKKVPKEDLEFGEIFLNECEENDFKILYERHFEFKNKITEKADIDAIDGYFEYDEVEYNGLMYAYNDVLPYGDQLTITLNGMECIIFDQYCLLPHCSCTDTILNIFSIDKIGKTGEELCVVSLKYKKKKWEIEKRGITYKINPDIITMNIAVRSLYLVTDHIPLTEMEAQAIVAHDGIYPVRGGVNNLDYHHNECRLQMIIHFADKWTAAVEEEGRK
jgi:hypothetical protein